MFENVLLVIRFIFYGLKDAGEMVRSFVGGLELIVSLLKSDETEVANKYKIPFIGSEI